MKTAIDKDWIFEIIDQTSKFSKQLIQDHFDRHQSEPVQNDPSKSQLAQAKLNTSPFTSDGNIQPEPVQEGESLEDWLNIPCYQVQEVKPTADDVLNNVFQECGICDVSDRFRSCLELAMHEYHRLHTREIDWEKQRELFEIELNRQGVEINSLEYNAAIDTINWLESQIEGSEG
jgi:hypothetical protein